MKLKPIPVENGVSDTVEGKIMQDFNYTLCRGEVSDEIQRTIKYKKNLQAPVQKNDIIGKVTYTMKEQTLEEIPIFAKKSVKKAKFRDYLYKLVCRWVICKS